MKQEINRDQDQLFMQSVNQELFQLMLVDYMEHKEQQRQAINNLRYQQMN